MGPPAISPHVGGSVGLVGCRAKADSRRHCRGTQSVLISLSSTSARPLDPQCHFRWPWVFVGIPIVDVRCGIRVVGGHARLPTNCVPLLSALLSTQISRRAQWRFELRRSKPTDLQPAPLCVCVVGGQRHVHKSAGQRVDRVGTAQCGSELLRAVCGRFNRSMCSTIRSDEGSQLIGREPRIAPMDHAVTIRTDENQVV